MMGPITRKLLDRLQSATGRTFQVDDAVRPGGDDIIRLHGSYVLLVDQEAEHPMVVLGDLSQPDGQIAFWTIREDASLDAPVMAALRL